MAVTWSYGTTKVIISEGLTTAPDPEWRYGESTVRHDLAAADTLTADGVGMDSKLYKQMAPIPDGTYTKKTDKEFDYDANETMVSKGY